MLTGVLSPGEGTASIMGLDILSQMDEIRKHVGVTPQHDVRCRNPILQIYCYIFTKEMNQ